MTDQKRELFAWLAMDSHGEEGIIAVPTAAGPWPLVSVDSAAIVKSRGLARMAAVGRNRSVRLVRFVEVEQLDTVTVDGPLLYGPLPPPAPFDQ